MRCDDEEEIGERAGDVVDGDLFFAHRFEQCGLDFGGGSVDFVDERDVGEDGTSAEFENVCVGVENHDARDVAGEQVGGELHAAKRRHAVGAIAQTVSERFCEGRFSASWEVFEQHVPRGQEGDDDEIDNAVAAHDIVFHAIAQKVYGFQGLFKTHRKPHVGV